MQRVRGVEEDPACFRTGEGGEECSGTRLIASEPAERLRERDGLLFCSTEREITFQKSVPLL